MTNQTNNRGPLETPRLPVQVKLAGAWGALMYLVLYIDYFHLYQPGEIDSIRDGKIFAFDISATFLTIGFVSIATLALMLLLSLTLPARANRAANLVAATLWIPFCAFNAAGATPDYALYYAVTIGVEVLILAFILRTAWTWPRTPGRAGATAQTALRQPA